MTSPSTTATLEDWMKEQREKSVRGMLKSLSATSLVFERPQFGQVIRPKPGSILASPNPGSYDPEPDYFFHWPRDSSVVIDAITLLMADGDRSYDWGGFIDDFLRFSLDLWALDGAAFIAENDYRANIEDWAVQYSRPPSELALVRGDRIAGDVRYNPDGTLDIKIWGRPQNDGPALRALALLRHRPQAVQRSATTLAILDDLVGRDLDYTAKYWLERCYDLWEEKLGFHYHTQLVQCAALEDGAAWAAGRGDAERAQTYADTASKLRTELDAAWSEAEGIYICRRGVEPPDPPNHPDLAVILGVIQAQRTQGRHSVLDDRVQATLMAGERLFAAQYAINRERGPGVGLAYGRYEGDKYFSGGAYYMTTLGAAEFYYRLAAAMRAGQNREPTPLDRTMLENLRGASAAGPADLEFADALVAKGDAIMAMVRKYTPPPGEMSEQFDQTTGTQTSAKNLAWSYASFLTALGARRMVIAWAGSPGSPT